ncbi:MAG: PRC-barrel domain-containing protein, partial [Candidatus Thorarchaeota archaeon]
MARPFCCNELKKMDVLDSNGKKLGQIGDLSFSFDGTLKISHFIMEGPAWTRFLESLHLKDDPRHTFHSSIIRKVDRHIHLSTDVNDLMSEHDDRAISDTEVRFSNLEKLDIIDVNGVKIGRAVDVDIDADGCASLIAGGGFLEEKLESAGLRDDVD